MECSLSLRALCLTGLVAPVLGAPAPIQAPVQAPALDPSAVRRIAMPACESPQAMGMKAGKVFARERYCIQGDTLYRFQDLPGGGQEVRPEPLPPAALGQGHYLKYDEGAFWIAEPGGQVSKWDPVLKRWIAYAHVPGVWRDFEVLPDGRILLTLTADAVDGPVRALVDVYDPDRGSFDTVLAFPGKATAKLSGPLENLFYGGLRLVAVDEHVLIYGGWSGRLWVYDAMRRRIEEVRLPWERFDFADLLQLFKRPGPRLTVAHPQASAEGPGEGIPYLIPPTPICHQFIPTPEGEVMMAYELMEPESRKRTQGMLQINLDTLEARPEPPSRAFRLPVWTDGHGGFEPLDEAFKPAAKPAPPASERHAERQP